MGCFLGKCFGMRGLSLGTSVNFPSISDDFFRLVEESLSGNSCVEPAFPLEQDSARRAPLAHESLVTQFFPGRSKVEACGFSMFS